MWIEIFRTGKHTDSRGRSEEFPPNRLDEIAALYNSKILEDPTALAPVVKGHPASHDPAYGWVDRLARRGNRLVAFISNIDQAFAEEVRQGRFKKISIALTPELMLRHVGFLGAVAPAVEGLEPADFTGDESYSSYEYSDFTVSDYDFVALQERNAALKREIELMRKESRLREFRQYANSLIVNEAGPIITPTQSDELIDLLEMAHNHDEQNNAGAEYSAVTKIKNFFSSLKPIMKLTEYRGTSQDGAEPDDFASANVDSERLKLHRRAVELQNEKPGLSYEEAVLRATINLNHK